MRLEVVERFPFPRSTTVAYTLSNGAEVIRYGTGQQTCGCRQFREETGPEHPYCDDPSCPCNDELAEELERAERRFLQIGMTESYEALPWRYGD